MKTKNPAYFVARMALLFALAAVLSFLEGMLPALPLPGVKLGLAHIVTMYTLFAFGIREGALLALLRGGLAFFTRGAVAGLLSLTGGLFSALVIFFLLRSTHCSFWLLSVCGALTHNLSQLVVSVLVIGSPVVVYYIPILMLSALVTGTLTAVLLRGTLPALSRIPSELERMEYHVPSQREKDKRRDRSSR